MTFFPWRTHGANQALGGLRHDGILPIVKSPWRTVLLHVRTPMARPWRKTAWMGRRKDCREVRMTTAMDAFFTAIGIPAKSPKWSM